MVRRGALLVTLCILTACRNAEPSPSASVPSQAVPSEGPLGLHVGRSLPIIELMSTGGARERVLRDEPTLVAFTGPWAPASVQTERALVALRQRLGKPLAMVLVDLGGAGDSSAPAEKKEGFRVVANPMGEVALPDPWQSASNPYSANTIFLVDRAGVLQRVFPGGKDLCVPCDPSFEPAVRAFLGP